MTDDTHGDGDTEDGRPRLAQLRDVETVYQPAEDSRLLAETATERGVDSGDRVLDVGTGRATSRHAFTRRPVRG
jgi:hypothetical protein